MEQCVKIKEEKEDDDESVKSEVPRASLRLEQEVRRAVRSVRQTTTYNHTTGKAAEISAAQNCFACLAELNNEEFNSTIEVENL